MRGDKSFAYDLLVRPGRVSGRVALLLRSTERKPVAGKICEKFSPHQCTTLCEVLEGNESDVSYEMGLMHVYVLVVSCLLVIIRGNFLPLVVPT
jgi:hypothetical protein